MKKYFVAVCFSFLLLTTIDVNAQTDSAALHKQPYQIFLKQPAKEIKLLMNEKDFTPIQGKLSEDRKSIIMDDYKQGTRIHVKVLYDDGTVDEFVKSPCYIDPVV